MSWHQLLRLLIWASTKQESTDTFNYAQASDVNASHQRLAQASDENASHQRLAQASNVNASHQRLARASDVTSA